MVLTAAVYKWLTRRFKPSQISPQHINMKVLIILACVAALALADNYKPGFRRGKNSITAIYNNAERQEAVNDKARYVGSGTGTERYDGVPGTGLDFGYYGHGRRYDNRHGYDRHDDGYYGYDRYGSRYGYDRYDDNRYGYDRYDHHDSHRGYDNDRYGY